MADRAVRQFSLSAPLCFIFTKFGILDIRRIKSTVSDYYSAKDTAMNETLFKDLANLGVPDATRIVQYHDSENRLGKEVDDIFNLMFWLDEKKFFDRLRKYICDSSDSIPSARLEDMDMLYYFLIK